MFSRAQPASLAGDCASTDETWAFVFYLVGDRAQARGLHSFCGRTRAPLCFQIAPALSIRGPQIEPKAKTKKTQMRRSAGRGPPGLLENSSELSPNSRSYCVYAWSASLPSGMRVCRISSVCAMILCYSTAIQAGPSQQIAAFAFFFVLALGSIGGPRFESTGAIRKHRSARVRPQMNGGLGLERDPQPTK